MAAALRLEIYKRAGDYNRVEAELQRLIENEPKRTELRRYIAGFYVSRGRFLDAERELRAIAAADPSDLQATLELVRFLNQHKGTQIAREELASRVSDASNFELQLAAAEFDFAVGERIKAVKSINALIASAPKPEQRANARVALASMNARVRDFAAAHAVLTQVLQEDHRNIDALQTRAVVQMEEGNVQGALADLRQALNERPGSAPLLGLLGIALERSGAIELAEKQFGDAARVSNFEPLHAMRYAAFLARRASSDRAEEVLSESVARFPRDVNVLAALAEAKLNRKDWSGALQLADAIKKVGDRSGRAEQIRGYALAGEAKLSESVEALNKSMRAAPGAFGPVKSLVDTYLAAGKPGEAELLLKGQLSPSNSNANLHVLMSRVRLALKDKDGALQSIKSAIVSQPQEWVGYYALGQWYLQERDTGAALEAIDAGLMKLPDNADLRILRATALEAAGNVDEAIAEYERLIARQPGLLLVANNLASLLADHREDKASLDRASELASMLRKSGIPQFKDTVGWVNLRKGDHRSAIPLLEEAAEALPAHSLIRYHLGVAYLKAGDPEKAREQLKKATDLEPETSSVRSKALQALKQVAG